MAVDHSTLTGAELHEPKGIESAAAEEIYIADGVGSGAWLPIPASTHGAAKVAGNTTEVTPTGAGDFVEWTPVWTAIDQDGVTVTDNSFVITEDGSYFITASLANQGRGTGTNIYAFDFAVDGVVTGQQTRRSTSSTTDTGAVPVQAYLADLTAGQVIKLYVTNESDTDNVLITDISLFIFRLN